MADGDNLSLKQRSDLKAKLLAKHKTLKKCIKALAEVRRADKGATVSQALLDSVGTQLRRILRPNDRDERNGRLSAEWKEDLAKVLDNGETVIASILGQVNDQPSVAAGATAPLPQLQFTGSLPPLGPFFGREKERAAIREALNPKSDKWGILIDGPGGMGKTSLAIQAADDCRDQFDQTVFLSVKERALDENGVRDLSRFLLPGLIEMLNELAEQLGQSHIANAPEGERMKRLNIALRNARALLILDNLESLPESDRDQLFTFVKNLPRTCKAILTTRPRRHRIGAAADTLYLDKLDQDAALETLAHLAERNPLLSKTSEAERLALYDQTGGSPLLLGWTAGQLGRGSCRTFSDALDFLRSCPKNNDLPEFVFGDIASEFEPDEEKVLIALGYFTLSAKEEHIAELTNLPAARIKTALDALANRSLVIPNREETHYTLVPMLADFLRKHRREVVGEIGDWLKKRAYNLISENGKEERRRFPVLDAAWPIVAPALPLFIEGPNERLQEVCEALDLFLDFTGRWDELISLHTQAEAKAVAADDFYWAGWRAYQIGWIQQLRGDSNAAHACAERASAHWNKAKDPKAGPLEKGRVTRLHGLAHQRAGNYREAIACCREALKQWRPVAKKNPKTDIIARGLNTLAENERLSGNLDGAGRHYREALSKARAIRYAQGIRTYIGGLAELELDRHNWLKAEDLARKALAMCKKVPHEEMIAENCHRIAKALLRRGKGAEGLSYSRDAEAIYTKLRSPKLEAVRETRRECERPMRFALYFAYGSNMNEAQFKKRCPSSHSLCRAKLLDHRFVITARGYASVLKQKGSTVYGVLCAITEADEKELDRREEVRENIYRREWLPAVTEFGYSLLALVYVDTMEDEGVPEDGYLEKILDGARRHYLPMEAIAEIETWAKKK